MRSFRWVAASCLTIVSFGGHAQDSPRFKSRVDIVNVTATVTDSSGRFVAGLDKSDFAVFEDGRRRDVVFFSDETAPVSLGILLDTSGSMTGRRLDLARKSVARLVTRDLDGASEWFLARFGYSLVVAQEWTTDRDAIAQPLREARATGDTALYDTIALAIPLADEGRLAKKALLVVSDGGESKSLLSLDDVRRTIGRNDVRILAIAVDAPGGSRGDRFDVDALRRIVDETGGTTRVVASEVGIPSVTTQIADELRHEYLLGYSTDFANDGRAHAIRVETLKRGMKVRARRGFVAN